LKHAGFTEIITDKARMERIIYGTVLGKLDTYEDDPHNLAPDGTLRKRPWGSVVGMRKLREEGRIETLSSVYELIEA